MNNYKLKITRTLVDVGYVVIKAESKDDALRKYWVPDYSKGERLVFDDEIDWVENDADYRAEVVS